MSNEKFDKFIKENTAFKPETSKADFENIKSYVERKNAFFNPFLPFLVSGTLVLVFTFILISKKTIPNTPAVEENLAETYLFESYFAIEDDLEASEYDENIGI